MMFELQELLQNASRTEKELEKGTNDRMPHRSSPSHEFGLHGMGGCETDYGKHTLPVRGDRQSESCVEVK